MSWCMSWCTIACDGDATMTWRCQICADAVDADKATAPRTSNETTTFFMGTILRGVDAARGDLAALPPAPPRSNARSLVKSPRIIRDGSASEIHWRSAGFGVCTAPGHALPTGRCSSARMGVKMHNLAKPAMRPARPQFSSGPTVKHPGWRLENLQAAPLGRSHRSKVGKGRLKEAIDRTREVLEVPDDFLIGIVPASDTGAVEMAMWSMLGPLPVQVAAWESFSKDWVVDIIDQLKLPGAEELTAPFGQIAADLVQGAATTPTSGVRLERHHLGRARTERRLHLRRPQGHRDLRCHQRRLRAAAGLGQARCGHLFLAEGAGGRGRPRHADPVAAGGGTAGKLLLPAPCRSSSA